MATDTGHTGVFSEATELFEQGEFSRCIELLHDRNNADVFAMYLRCLIRLERCDEVVQPDVLERIADSSSDAQMTAYTLVASALSRLTRYDEAGIYFEKARSNAIGLGASNKVTAELDCLQARHFFQIGKFDAALQLTRSFGKYPAWRMKAIDLRSWILAIRGDLPGQVRLLLRALTYQQAGERWTRAAILHTLSARIRELHFPQFADRVIEAAEAFPWTSDMSALEFFTFRNIGWITALNAQTIRAHDYYVRAAAAARNNPAQRVLILADEAFLALTNSERVTIESKMASAAKLIKSVSWSDCGQARSALLLLAELAARMGNGADSKKYFELYAANRKPLNEQFPLGEWLEDDLQWYTKAWVERALGNREKAIELFTEVFERWKACGFRWRAVLTALALCDLDPRDEYFEFAIEETQEHFPLAWFAKDVIPHQRRLASAVYRKLSNTQRNIVQLLVEGKRNKQIADELVLSPNTVRSRLSELYLKFTPDQTNRAALVSLMKDYGL